MNNQGQWNRNRYGFNQQRNRMGNNYRQPRYQNFSMPNFNRGYPVLDFEQNTFQPIRIFSNGGNKNNRCVRNFNVGSRNRRVSEIPSGSWQLEDEEIYGDVPPVNFRSRQHYEVKMLQRDESSSLPPLLSSGRNKSGFLKKNNHGEMSRSSSPFPNRSFTDIKDMQSSTPLSSPYKRPSSRLDSSETQETWSDTETETKEYPWIDSENGGLVKEEEEAAAKPLCKEDNGLTSVLWNEDSDENEVDENGSSKTPDKLKHTASSLPEYDGKTVLGDEGIFQIKVYRCSFCNIICMDDEKCKAHLLTKYHYGRYKKFMLDN